MTEDNDLAPLLEFLKQSRGFDFSGYKRSSLERRIQKRMQAAGPGFESYRDYLEYLEVTPDEFGALFDTILINVTSFFRDADAWEYMAETIIPELIKNIPDSEPIRVWSAGCSSGEEAYTIAMLLAEQLGQNEFKARVKIYATDVDEDALNTARAATFSRDAVQPIPTEFIDRYFESSPSGYVFRSDLRRQVIFGRNDLVQDAPISRVDLLISRNTLMYFTAEAQSQILEHLNFSLRERGYLFLGKSEMLITHARLFKPHDLKWRVFRKVPRSGVRQSMSFVADGGGQEIGSHLELRSAALENTPLASLVVDREGFLVSANAEARTLLKVTPTDLGQRLQDIEVSYRPAELRSVIDDAYKQGTVQRLPQVRWSGPDGMVELEIEVRPLPATGGSPVGVTINFRDVTELVELDAQHERSKQNLEQAHSELQSTVEELETTNEELHSTNEELETTNEELQSTNEELETMNEELQSSNDELETMNDDHRTRSGELDRLNFFLEGILGSLGVAVIVVDEDARVQVWNESAADLWGLRTDEVAGTPFLELDIGLPVTELSEPIREALRLDGSSSDVLLDSMTRRGRSMRCWVRVQPLTSRVLDSRGAILLMGDGSDGVPELPSTMPFST